jgi:xylulokinase
MDPPQLVGIHLSPSSIHVAVYTPDGELLTKGTAEVKDQTTVAWERALREAAPSLPTSGICSVASTSGTTLLVDEYGEPIFPPQMYYEGAPTQSARLEKRVDVGGENGKEIALSPTAPLSKILKLREEHPERFSNVEWILSPTTWLLYRLCNGSSTRWRDIETDWTNALKFGADVTASVPEWFDSLYETVGLDPSLLPTIRPPGSFVGTADSELAQRTGLDNLRLFQGVTDGNAFVLANGCFEPGEFSVTFGGASVVKYVSESIKPHDALYYHRHPLNGYLSGAAFDSGEALRWFFDRVLETTAERGLELARATDAGEEYEMFLEGNRGPFFDQQVGSSLLGLRYDRSLSVDTVHGKLARGLTTGIVLAEWTYISIIEDHFDTTIEQVRLLNDDAPTPDDSYAWWNEYRASVWDRSIIEMEPRTIAGLLIPAALISSVYKTPEEAKDRLLRRRDVVKPDRDISDRYAAQRESYFARWRDVANLYGHESSTHE